MRKRFLTLVVGSGLSVFAVNAGAQGNTENRLHSLEEQVKALTEALAAEREEHHKEQEQYRKEREARTETAGVTSSDLENVQADVKGVQSDVEAFKWQWRRERELRTAITSRPLTIGGVVQARAYWGDNKVNTATVYDRNSSFDIGAAILSFNGALKKDYEFGKNLTYRLSFGASPQAGASSLSVLDANISYALLPTLDIEQNQLAFTFGQRLLPFGLEVAASEELKPVINNAQFASRLDLAQRQIGVFATGDYKPFVDYGFNYRAPLISYDVGVVNGAGTNNSDNNSAKDVVGRVQLIVPPGEYDSWLREIKIGLSGYVGEANLLDPVSKTIVDTGKRDRYGLDVSYNHNPIGFTLEHIRGKDEVATSASGRNTLDSEATTVTAFYNWGEQFVKGFRAQARYDDWWPKTYQPFFRWDRFDPDTSSSDNASTVYTLGFNWFLAQTTKLQINLNLVEADRFAAFSNGIPIKDDKQVLVQAQFGF